MRIDCRHCNEKMRVEAARAGQLVRCARCGKSFIAPSRNAVAAQHHTLTEFPVLAVVALNCVTGGLFSIIHLNMMHDHLPRIRPDDPTGLKALGLCLLPLVNIYWVFFTFHRLCVRINEQRAFHGLPDSAPAGVALAISLLTACALATPWIKTSGFVFLGVLGFILLPVFAAMVQRAANEVVRISRPQGTMAA